MVFGKTGRSILACIRFKGKLVRMHRGYSLKIIRYHIHTSLLVPSCIVIQPRYPQLCLISRISSSNASHIFLIVQYFSFLLDCLRWIWFFFLYFPRNRSLYDTFEVIISLKLQKFKLRDRISR